MSIFKHEHHEDSSDEYATPRWFVQPLADALDGFDLDPASGAEPEPHAETIYTEEDDGLAHDWFGDVWCNPPFSEKVDWIDHAIEQHGFGNTDRIVMLLPVDVSTGWFHHDLAPAADLLWFREGRLSFEGGSRNRNPTFGTMLAVFANSEIPDDLLRVLHNRGLVVDASALHTPTEQATLGDLGGEDR